MSIADPLFLKTPPIIESIIGISIPSLFNDENEIKKAYETTKLRELFPSFKPTKNISFNINDKIGNTIIDEIEGYVCSSDNVSLYLEKNRLTLSDRSKYVNFETILNKYEEVWKIIEIVIEGKEKKMINDIGLKFVNKFNLKMSKDNIDKVRIKPTINLIAKNSFGFLNEFFGAYKIFSDMYDAEANVVMSQKAIENNSLQYVFEIDVHDTKVRNIDFESAKEVLFRLRQFKNNIFFANLPVATEMEEFK